MDQSRRSPGRAAVIGVVAAWAALAVLVAVLVDGRDGPPATPGGRPGAAATTSAAASPRPLLPLRAGERVLFLGDSITEQGGISRDWSGAAFEGPGWLSVLSRLAAARSPDLHLAFVNRGVGGNQVHDLLARLRADVLDAKPDVVVIYIGINDAWRSADAGTSPVSAFTDGLSRLVRSLLDAGIRVLVCTPTVIGEKAVGDNQYDDVLQRYERASARTAGQLGVPVCDLSAAFRTWLAQHNAGNVASGLLTTDGVHLTDEGNKLVADTVGKALGLA